MGSTRPPPCPHPDCVCAWGESSGGNSVGKGRAVGLGALKAQQTTRVCFPPSAHHQSAACGSNH
jgi:hypothetical protein